MSEKHLYEKHLAEKLQQVSPPPDMEGNWQKMRSLLDDDQPRGGGFGKRWWQLSVIAAILLIGGWLAGTQFLQTGEEKNSVVVTQPNPASVEEKNAAPDKNVPGTGNQAVANGKATTPDGQSPGQGEPIAANGSNKAPDAANGSNKTRDAANGSNKTPDAAVKEEPLATRKNNKAAETGGTVLENNKTADPVLEKNNSTIADAGSKTRPNTKNSGRGRPTVTNADNGNEKDITRKNNNKKSTTDDLTLHSDKANITRKPVDYSPLDENTSYTSAAPAPADNLKTDFSLLSLSTKAVLKSKSARAGKNRNERSFSFGFSLPLAFPLGDQKALSYNFNAGANTVSDYIPSPHVQYRLSNKTYLQTELQFISPQYIRPILLYETRVSQAGSYMVYNSIYARKLYYFNLPVGIHHSPFDNFYLGTGLQFSTLLSGVGLYEQTKRDLSGNPMSLLSERYGRLNGDSLTHRMNTAEVRLMLEMNYYVNRFTFGLRYNQAFNNYVNFRIDNMHPYTFDKNKALQFYLRYNLWEDVRRRPNGKGLLSSK